MPLLRITYFILGFYALSATKQRRYYSRFRKMKMYSKRPHNIPSGSRRFLSSSALTMMLIAALTPGANAQIITDTGKPAVLSAEARTQILALQEEKESRTTTERKIDSHLLYAYRMANGQPVARGINSINTSITPDKKGMVLVDITAQVNVVLLKQIARTGEIVSSHPEANSIRARMPLNQMLALASNTSVRFIRPADEAMLSGRSISATPEWQARHAAVPMTRAERETRLRALLPGLLAKARQSAIDKITDTPMLPGLTPGFQSNALVAMLPPLSPVYHEMGTLFATGNINSEGDVTHRANLARTNYKIDGSGIKIGVLSDGVNTLSTSQSTGELGPVTVLTGQAGNGNEGTAMLEIVHDLAPGAQLYFASAFNGVSSFAQNIRDLRAAGCDIIVDDVFYFNESPFQDGPIAQAVNDVTADGGLYFSSAGNQGNVLSNTSTVWEGDYVDGGAVTIEGNSGSNARLHSFGSLTYDQAIGLGGSLTVTLFWADPLGKSNNDYDLYVLNSSGSSVASFSNNVQNGSQDPYEQASTSNNQRIVIVKRAGAAARFLHVNMLDNGGGTRLNFNTLGQTKGHASAIDAFCVAASPVRGPYPNPFNTTNGVESFSSDGPRRMFYEEDGTPITPGNFSATGGTVRAKPDITAADGGRTSVSGFDPFFGTSAAAPHAAAIAGLLKSYNPALTPAQMRTALQSTAIDILAAGFDNTSGSGIVDALNILGSVPAGAFTSLDVTTTTPNGGKTIQGTVTLHDPAPAGGAVVALSATPSGIVTLPSSVTVPAGQKTANFNITTAVVSSDKTVTIKGTYAGITHGVDITVFAKYQIAGGVTTMDGGTPISGVTLTASGTGTAALPIQSVSPNIAIPDGNANGTAGAAVTASLPLNTGGTVTSVKVGVNITHTWRGDLRVTLIHPDGTRVRLKDTNGSDSADNVITSYPDQTAPVESLSTLVGKSVNGTWKLEVQDFFNQDTGTLKTFTLDLVANGVPVTLTTTTTSNGTYAFTDQFPGTFTLTPSKTGFDFNPKSRNVTIGPDSTGTSFALTQVGVRLSATIVRVLGEYRVTLTCANGSSASATNLQITRAALGAAASPTSPALPSNLGTISSGNSGSVLLRFPVSAGASGTKVLLKISGTSSLGAVGGTLQVTLPSDTSS